MEEKNKINKELNNKIIENIDNKFSSDDLDKNLKEKSNNENKTDLKKDLEANINLKKDIDQSIKTDVKPKKEIPIEKKPFNEFINGHLIPNLRQEFKHRGLEIREINLKNTLRPISGDKCWVIYCEIKDTCNFWLSFEKEDISSLKSISLSKPNQNPSIIESFLIDEKRISLKLIVSRILQRLNGQKLIGVN